MRRKFLVWGGLAASAGVAPWPRKPVRMLVRFPGGSSPDLSARALAEPLSKALGQPVIADNRPGASGNIAADMVAKANDDHTLGLMNPKSPYDPLKDLAPVSLIGTAPLVLTVPASYAGTAQDFVATGLRSGNIWSYGSPGLAMAQVRCCPNCQPQGSGYCAV